MRHRAAHAAPHVLLTRTGSYVLPFHSCRMVQACHDKCIDKRCVSGPAPFAEQHHLQIAATCSPTSDAQSQMHDAHDDAHAMPESHACCDSQLQGVGPERWGEQLRGPLQLEVLAGEEKAGHERRRVCWAPHVGAHSLVFKSAGRLNKHTRLPWCDAGDGHCGPDARGAGRFQLADAHPRGPLLNGELQTSAASGPAVGLPPHTSAAPVDAHPSRLVLCLDVGAIQLWPRRGCVHRPQLTATIVACMIRGQQCTAAGSSSSIVGHDE